MNTGHRVALLVGLACVVVLLRGCGGSDRPKLGRVHGTVTLDNQPLADARVQFTPEDPADGRDSIGWTDARGRYELLYIRDVKGAAVGEHTVRITVGGEEEAETSERVPAWYNAETILQETVEAGSKQIDFELTSRRPG